MHMTDFSTFFKDLRLEQARTQQDISDRIAISVSQISRIENCERGLSIDRLGSWARALGYRAEIVLFPTEDASRWGYPAELEEDVLVTEENQALLDEVRRQLPRLSPEGRSAVRELFGLWRGALDEDLPDTPMDDD